MCLLSLCPLADLTLREAVSYPTPMLETCSSPGRSSWETQLTLPMTQTHGEVVPWPEFDEGSHEVLDRLDDSRRIYGRPESGVLHGRRAETQDKVEMHLSRIMDGVNDAAEELSIPVHCCGGSGRCMSHAAMIMRPAGAHCSAAWLSKHILGVILVTCDLQLHRGERLEDALRDPLRSERITALLQQVVPHAYCARAPGMICYHSGILPRGQTSLARIEGFRLIVQGKGLMSRSMLEELWWLRQQAMICLPSCHGIARIFTYCCILCRPMQMLSWMKRRFLSLPITMPQSS